MPTVLRLSALVILPSIVLGGAIAPSSGQAPPRAATLLIELGEPPGRPLVEENRAILDTPVAPGSIVKIVTLLAALESGTITTGSSMACPRRVVAGGDTYTCTHPDIGRPLTPAEALGHSCNTYFASVASRLPRAALGRAFLRAGLPPPSPRASTVRVALGLDGVRATPRQLLASFVRIVAGTEVGIDARHHRVLLEGLRLAATEGTARSLGDSGIAALAKTGTAPRGGAYLGLAVAALPPDRPAHAIIVVVPGAAGLDAAALAADRLRERPEIMRKDEGPAFHLAIGRARKGGYDVVPMSLEEYVAGVVTAEATSGSPPEASKALAVVARTFALANRGRHRGEGFDLCDLTHCQAVARPAPFAREAAAATSGLTLTHQGKPAQVFYSASCGGHSERPSSVWPGASDPPYLVARPEPECRLDRPWTSEVSAAQVAAAMRAAGSRGDVVRGLRVGARTASGRAATLEAAGFDPPVVSAEAFRVALGRIAGWQLLKSTAFEIERRAGGYRFVGRGRGHGVGLCVEGAARLARAGSASAAILAHYFPGARLEAGALPPPITPVPHPPTVEVVVPSGEESGREAIRALAVTALSDIALAAGMRVPSAVRLVFHSTVQAYTRATGLSWWTAAATRGGTVDLLPPSILRRRRLLEKTVRHEMAHVVLGDRLADRPAWAQEGAAMFLAGEFSAATANRTSPGAATSGCPTDAEILRARSADAAKMAYARAAACFQRGLAAGRRWDGVGLPVSTSVQ